MNFIDKFLNWLFPPLDLGNWSEEEEEWFKEAEEFLKFLNEYEASAEQGVEPLVRWLEETPKIAIYDPENDPEGAKKADDYIRFHDITGELAFNKAVESMELCNEPDSRSSFIPSGFSFEERNDGWQKLPMYAMNLDEKREAINLPKLPKKKPKKTTPKKKTTRKKK